MGLKELSEIALAVLITAVILVAEHYGLKEIKGRDLTNMECYVYGVLALYLPLTGLFVLWQYTLAVIAMWLVAVCAGFAVWGMYQIDGRNKSKRRMIAAEMEGRILRNEVGDDGERAQNATV